MGGRSPAPDARQCVRATWNRQAALGGAIHTAQELGATEIEVAHLLLHSLDHEQSFWSRLCARLDLDPSDVREAIHLALRGN